MDQALIFWPMMAHAALVMIVYLELGRRRFSAAKKGLVQHDDYKVLNGMTEPAFVGQAARNIVNNFEAPVFFHLLILALYLLNFVTWPLLLLAWVFVGLRCLHSLIHLTWNNVLHRGLSFLGGLFVLFAMWILFAIRLSAGPV